MEVVSATYKTYAYTNGSRFVSQPAPSTDIQYNLATLFNLDLSLFRILKYVSAMDLISQRKLSRGSTWVTLL